LQKATEKLESAEDADAALAAVGHAQAWVNAAEKKG